MMKTGITIETEGGLITSIWSTHIGTEINIIDHDTAKDDDVSEEEYNEYLGKIIRLDKQKTTGERVPVY